MHTFFINTSKKSLQDYAVLFDVYEANKTFLPLECPMEDWLDLQAGYRACLQKMGELIDGYAEIDDTFNLVVYVDLLEHPVYAAIARAQEEDVQRNAVQQAMQLLLTRWLSKTLLSALVTAGRRPQEVLLMVGTDKRDADRFRTNDAAGENAIDQKLHALLGLPEKEQVIACAKKLTAPDAQRGAELEKALSELYSTTDVYHLRDCFAAEIREWCWQIAANKDYYEPTQALYQNIRELARQAQEEYRMQPLACPYDCEASKTNQKVMALSRLNIALHLLRCIQEESVYREPNPDHPGRTLIPFGNYKARQLVQGLEKKRLAFLKKRKEMESLGQLGLVTELLKHPFDYEKFGLNESGEPNRVTRIYDAEPEEAPETDPQKTIGARREKRAVLEQQTAPVLLQGYTVFEDAVFASTSDDKTREKKQQKKLRKQKNKVAAYEQWAKGLSDKHAQYLQNLQMHVSDVLSNYAVKSKDNRAALLQLGSFRYEKPMQQDGEKPHSLETQKLIAGKAYRTVFERFMRFCAAREVDVTDLSGPVAEFVSKVQQIDESLNNLRKAGWRLSVALCALYVPLAVLQFDAITENLLTGMCAVGAFTLPLILLHIVLRMRAAKQRRKFTDLCYTLLEQSKKEREANDAAVGMFDTLLHTQIPALRWVYEFKLDVECCETWAALMLAKYMHHSDVLQQRVVDIENILRDLDMEPRGYTEQELSKPTDERVNYNVPFCAGTENRQFYGIVSEPFWQTIIHEEA